MAAHRPIYRGEARRHVVSLVVDALRDWRLSPFENEAACITGLRSGLCLKHHGWSRANQEALDLVSTGLRIIGAHRPTHEQGQREYVTPREDCSWCGRPNPNYLLKADFNVIFCSPECGRAAIAHRDFRSRTHETEAYRSALKAIERGKYELRLCRHCGEEFRPLHEEGFYCGPKCRAAAQAYLRPRQCPICTEAFQPRHVAMKYCSRECQHVGNGKLFPANCRCEECGQAFRGSPSKRMRFCSRACHQKHLHDNAPARTCGCCGSAFNTVAPNAQFCSPVCQHVARIVRTGTVKKLTPPVFDYMVRMAA